MAEPVTAGGAELDADAEDDREGRGALLLDLEAAADCDGGGGGLAEGDAAVTPAIASRSAQEVGGGTALPPPAPYSQGTIAGFPTVLIAASMGTRMSPSALLPPTPAASTE